MAIREDLVASAVQFLSDPSVASSSVENRIAFLRSKNLTQEEVDASLARAGGGGPPPSGPPVQYQSSPSAPPPQYYQSYPQNAWQPPPPPPGRDWRDWFIMATVVGGVGYGIYSLGKRYVYPLVAPPTPEKLEQDKKSVEEQFDRAFSLVEQLAQDTESLKKSEQERTERLDGALSDLEVVMKDLKAANRRREDDAQRIRDEIQTLKSSIPKAMDNQKTITDNRLKEINTELTSLKTLVSQRMSAPPAATSAPSFPRSITTGIPTPTPSTPVGYPVADTATPAAVASTATNGDGAAEGTTNSSTTEPPKTTMSSIIRGPSGSGRASIPAWQLAMKNNSSTTTSSTEEKKEEATGTS